MHWEMWGKRRYEFAELRHAVEDLKATDFRRLTDRFLRVNVSPGDVDWFDDDAWAVVLHNFEVAARVAKEGGCRGFMFDTEQYAEHRVFNYGKLNAKAPRSFAEYRAKVRQRGRELMGAVGGVYPDITVMLTWAYEMAQPSVEGERLETTDYSLLPSFLDGMLEACPAGATLVDGHEPAYGYRPKDFPPGLELMRRGLLEYTAVPDAYRRHVRAAFGVWMDYFSHEKGWETADAGKNYFTPESFGESVRAALRHSDRYVWVYTEVPRWWTDERIPAAYREVLRKVKERR
jgi:hypothetical protein